MEVQPQVSPRVVVRALMSRYTASQIAAKCSVSRRTVYHWRKSESIPRVTRGLIRVYELYHQLQEERTAHHGR